jgi:outer membrane protein insertion porin family
MNCGVLETPPTPRTAPAGRTRRRRSPRGAALLALAALLPALAGRSRGDVEAIGTITEVRFVGNASITEEQLRGKITSRAGRPLDRKVVEDDLKRLLATSWFTTVRPKYVEDPQRKGFVLIFEVQERPVLTAVEFRGRRYIRLKELEDNTGLKKGARADHLKNLMAIQQIKRLYEEKGYEFAEVTLLEGGKPGDTRAIFQIAEGPKCRLHSIGFEGNTFVSDGVLRTKIASKPPLLATLGGRYHSDEVEEDARKLREYYQSNGFFEVEVTPVKRPGTPFGNIDLVFVISEGVQYHVRNIKFEGNEKIPTAKLRDGMLLHAGLAYSDALGDADRKSLETKYGALGCIDVEINRESVPVDGEKGVVDLTYHIKEGEPYLLGRLIFKGNGRTRDRVLRREAVMAGLMPGEPIDVNRIELFRKRLTNLRYFNTSPQQQGSKPIEIKLVNRRPNDQPYADPGSATSLDEVIRTRFQSPDEPPRRPMTPAPPVEPLAPGEGPAAVAPFGPGPIFDPPPDGGVPPIVAPAPPAAPAPAPAPAPPANRAVPAPPAGAGEPPGTFPSIPGLNTSDVGPDRQEPFPNRAYADIVTSVDEGPTGRLMFGVGASSFQGLSGNFIIHESNFDLFNVPRSFRELISGQAFRGAGQDFEINIQPGTLINRAMVSFRDPYLFDLPIGLGVQGYYFQRYYADWTENRGGGRFSLGRQFGIQTYADVAFRIESVDFHSFRVPAPADFLAAAGYTTLASIRPSLRFDNRNDPFSPNKGQYLELAFEEGWGTFTFPKFTAEGRVYFPTGSRPDGSGKRFVTFRAFYGISGRDTPVYERFFAGDFRSMRGFAYRGVGPHVLGVNVGGIMTAIGSLEYQFPLLASDKLQQVVFCDFGTVESGYNFTSFRAAVGTGLRVYLPQQLFGPLPLAFDLAFPVAREPGDHTRYFTFFIGAFW